MLVGFADLPGMPESLEQSGITLGNPTPQRLYSTDIYTMEYDGYADFPRYPLNFLSSLNAFMGMATQHMAYLGLTPDQIARGNPAGIESGQPDQLLHDRK